MSAAFYVTFEETEQSFVTGFDSIYRISGLPFYEGEYVITPSVEAQLMETANTQMKNDVTIEAIPYYEVSNEHNGLTAVIG